MTDVSRLDRVPSETVERKLSEIRRGRQPRVLDLFSGCGGLSLGFFTEGFDMAGAVDDDSAAVKTHARNFPGGTDGGHPRSLDCDLQTTEAQEVAERLEPRDGPRSAFDVVIGGPPCQAYSRVGRAKLRDVAEDPAAHMKDPRRDLYLRFLDYVKELEPVCVVMENVPDSLSLEGHNIPGEVCEVLDDIGYQAGYMLLNAVHYGVPQYRERVFVLAYHGALSFNPRVPSPSHGGDLPSGYVQQRRAMTGDLPHPRQVTLPGSSNWFLGVSSPQGDGPPPVTAREALEDLPPIVALGGGRVREGHERFQEAVPYGEKPVSDYARLMRTWPGFEAGESVQGHVIRRTPRDYRIFRRMEPGDEYPEAVERAERIFEEELERLEKLGERPREGSKGFEKLKRHVVPPYDPGMFPNQWWKLVPDEPVRTLMAHLGRDSYTHIHYDDDQARTISVREAARLQSFPDGFLFEGSMGPAFRHVGNAVPPLLSRAVAREVSDVLRGSTPSSDSAGET